MIVGLTGGIGSGKSTVASMFNAYGIPLFIADTAGKELMNNNAKVITEIKQLFGEEAYKEGRLNSGFIAEIVFSDKEKLAKLNAVIHPAVATYFREWYEKQHSPYVIKETAILFESGSYKNCDVIITVTAPEEVRINRVVLRDGITREAVELRMRNQWSEEEKIKESDFVIENIDLQKTKQNVAELHQILLKELN